MPPKTEKTAPEKIKKPRRPISEVITLSVLFQGSLILCALTAAISSGYYSLHSLYESRKQDLWAIVFLQLEQQGSRVLRKMENFESEIDPLKGPDILLKFDSPESLTKVKGAIPQTVAAKDFKLEKFESLSRWSILQKAGANYLAKWTRDRERPQEGGAAPGPGAYLALWNVSFPKDFVENISSAESTNIYLITREGQLLFSNNQDITAANFGSRPLVQAFIQAPLTKSITEFSGEQGTTFGFFYEVPSSNLILFGETPRSIVMAPVFNFAIKFAGLVIVVALTMMVLLHYPLSSLSSSLLELGALCKQIGAGNVHVQPRRVGLGEVGVLTRSFNEMILKLSASERPAEESVPSQAEASPSAPRAVVEREKAVLLFPPFPLPAEAGLEVSYFQICSNPEAADWTMVHFDPETGDSILILLDVSGRGTDTTIVVGMAAALFRQVKDQMQPFQKETFLLRLNQLLLELTPASWTARCLIGTFQKNTGELELMNAGYPIPLFIADRGEGPKASRIRIESTSLGFSEKIEPSFETVPLAPGDTLLFASNGYLESFAEGQDREYERLFEENVESIQQPNGALWVQNVKNKIEERLKDVTPEDDMVAIRIKLS